MKLSPTPLSVLVALGLCGCYTADLDPDAEGVYRCRIDDPAAPDVDCPDGLSCDGRTCVSQVPALEIRSPEDREAFDDASGVVINVVGSGLDLNAEEGAPNAGFVRVSLDEQTIDITSGPLSDGIVVSEFEVSDTPGGHRIRAQAFRPDGTPFGNAQAVDSRLFWMDDGRPHVAILEPSPGSDIDIGTPLVDFEAAVLNFDLSVSDTDPVSRQGHIHIYYEEDFPACFEDPVCDSGYIAVVAASPGEGTLRIGSTAATVPESSETTATITAVLRQNNHDPFCFHDEDEQPPVVDGTQLTLEDCWPGDEPLLVTDTITINRVSL